MIFPTRQELIKQGKWSVKQVDTKELGRVTLAAPSAAGMFRFREIQGRYERKEIDDASRTAEMLSSGLVDENGEKMFSPGDAHSFFEVIGTDTMTKLMRAYIELVKGEDKAPTAEGADLPPAGAGPSAG